MTARCQACGALVGFRATRGARLADRRCACGGAFRLVQADGSPVATRPKGRTVTVRCVIDGRRRRIPGYAIRSPYPLAVETGWGESRPVVLVRRGDPVCVFHRDTLEPIAWA